MRRKHLVITVLVALLALGTGAVLSASLAKGGAKRIASLKGSNEIPVADPDGSGKASIRLDKGDGEVCFDLNWRNIASPTMAHIHQGTSTQNGSIVVALFETQTSTALPTTITSVEGCVTGVGSTLIEDIKDNPGNYYVNIHNAEFPNGAIRGQLHEPK